MQTAGKNILRGLIQTPIKILGRDLHFERIFTTVNKLRNDEKSIACKEQCHHRNSIRSENFFPGIIVSSSRLSEPK